MDNRRLERSDTVLWTLSPPGILLHNFARRFFLELDGIGYQAWGFLDGARTVDDVVARCCSGHYGSVRSRRALESNVREIVDTLAAHGFVMERVE